MAKISDTYARILHKGHNGKRVGYLQEVLNGFGNKLAVDGDFGAKTATAVAAFQRDHGINADGIVNRRTATAIIGGPGVPKILFSGGLDEIFPTGSTVFATAPFPVRGQAGAIALLGDPFVPGWDDEYLTRITLPPELFKKATAAKTTPAHIYAAENFKAAVRLMLAAGLKFTTFDGILCKRKKRGGSSLSTHAWAIAGDFDAALNPMGAKPKMAPEIVALWKRSGFLWGGDWASPDGMHVQRVTGI